MPTHIAENHRVVIFVVPDNALQGEGPPVGPGRQMTAHHMECATEHVRKHAPALLDNVTAVIVVGDKAGTFLNGTLVPHDQAIKHAAIRMYTESDQIEWECDQAFEIVSTEKAHQPIWYQPGTPDNPFLTGPPFMGECGSDTRYRARSSQTSAAANGQQYKVTIRIGGRDIDPDYVCGSPPPSP